MKCLVARLNPRREKVAARPRPPLLVHQARPAQAAAASPRRLKAAADRALQQDAGAALVVPVTTATARSSEGVLRKVLVSLREFATSDSIAT